MSGRSVNMAKWIAAALGLACCGALLGCAPQKPSDVDARELEVEADDLAEIDDREAIVARVAGEAITREEFNRRIGALEEFAQVRFQSRERRSDLLTRVVAFEILADEAERRGYGSHAYVRRAMKRAMADRYLDDRIGEDLSISDIGEAERRAYFEAHADELGRPERRRLSRLWVADEERALELVEQWQQEAPDEVDEAMQRFQRFAFRYSQDRESGDFGGRSQWYEADDEVFIVDDLFDRAPAALHGPTEIDDGYVLEMVVDVEEAYEPNFDDVEQEVARRIYEERRAERRAQIVERLMADAEIEIFDDRLEQVQRPPDEAVPRLRDIPRVGSEPGQ
jgi:peptidyl-prolyl cis-trans isomerase C